tara:strand:+ start:91 stop:576 length:486 start_codon:yes stop_codon:yes gene_type:complete
VRREVAAHCVPQAQQLRLKLIKWLLLLSTLIGGKSLATPLVPAFRTGTLTTNSSSTQLINETVSVSTWRSGYSYSASGNNIKTDTYINPAAITKNEQTHDGVKFSWTSPQMESIPKWNIVNEGQPFTLVESIIPPGLDSVTTVTRQIQTSTQTESISVFGQ